MEKLLENYIRFIEEEIDNEKKIDADIKISEQFDEILDETDFILGTIKFEINECLDIPRTEKNYELTMRELAEKISELPRIKKSTLPAFMKKKKIERDKIAREMAASMARMFS